MVASIPIHPQDISDVELLILSHHPLLFIEEEEEARVEALLREVALRMGLPFFDWRVHRGLIRSNQGEVLEAPSPPEAEPGGVRIDRAASSANRGATSSGGANGGKGESIRYSSRNTPTQAAYKTESPAACLGHLYAANLTSLAYLRDLQSHLESAEMLSRLDELHELLHDHRGAIVLSGDISSLPQKVRRLFTSVRLREPELREYHAFVSSVVADVQKRMQVRVEMTREEVNELLQQLRGMPFMEIRKIVTQAAVEDGRLSREDMAFVLEAKKRVVEKAGQLEYIPVSSGLNQMAGLGRLKGWLKKREIFFDAPHQAEARGLSPPRGLLLTGVQGCGKSLAARAISTSFRLPLLRLDPATLFSKYMGESEQNLRRALHVAEQVSPAILWIDEIEKAFSAQGDNDGGTARRIFGTFLTWMQEKAGSVFVFATANDISQLPPELLRKGRFDEIFFVDLPSFAVRKDIFALHLARKKYDLRDFDFDELAGASEGYSGAEIEQAVLSGIFTALSEERALDTALLLAEMQETRPLSVTMSERVSQIREWARERAVFVDD